MCRQPARVIVEGDQLFEEFKGLLTENYAGQALKEAYSAPLYYRSSERGAEVDFFFEDERKHFPLEVKSLSSTKKKVS